MNAAHNITVVRKLFERRGDSRCSQKEENDKTVKRRLVFFSKLKAEYVRYTVIRQKKLRDEEVLDPAEGSAVVSAKSRSSNRHGVQKVSPIKKFRDAILYRPYQSDQL
jgi:hypothetical protein